jgi:hypothetical protein
MPHFLTTFAYLPFLKVHLKGIHRIPAHLIKACHDFVEHTLLLVNFSHQ